jgi:transcriptional regulator with XRE-family HTH domain
MIGKYERGENLPSIEVIVKLAKAFEVSVDYLLGEGLNASYDKEMVKRLDEVEHLPADEKQRIYYFMDLVIRDHKTKAAYATK